MFARPLKLAELLEIKKRIDLWRNMMKLSAPKQITWFIALALAVIALLGQTAVVAPLTPYSFWLALIAAALLLIATIVKGL
jgi:fatty acid desaturase